MLLSIPDVLSPDEITALRALLDQSVWRDGRATAGGQAIHAKQNEQLRTDSEAAQTAQERVLQALNRSALFFSAALPHRIFPPQFNRYSGETNTYGGQRIKLPAGDAVLYPGTSVHGVEPVTRGQRLASFFWIESMVRSDEQRRLLFDLDMNLLRLRQQGESPVTVGLTGTYHNLLRMWAEV